MCNNFSMRKPELDYAFLASYAAIRDGSLTALDASFTVMAFQRMGSIVHFSLAGRIRADEQAQSVPMKVELFMPGDPIPVRASIDIDLSTEGAARYDGKLGLLFALQFDAPVTAEGLCQVRILIDNEEARVLKFDARLEPHK